MSKIIDDILFELKKQRISQAKLADITGLPQKSVNNLLAGRTKRLDMDFIGKLQTALNIVSEPQTPYKKADEEILLDEVEKMVIRKMKKLGKAYQFRWLAEIEAEEEAELKKAAATTEQPLPQEKQRVTPDELLLQSLSPEAKAVIRAITEAEIKEIEDGALIDLNEPIQSNTTGS
jgi:transcriptional regulator with XRE-family HTH domain